MGFSMTSILEHRVAQLTECRFLPKNMIPLNTFCFNLIILVENLPKFDFQSQISKSRIGFFNIRLGEQLVFVTFFYNFNI